MEVDATVTALIGTVFGGVGLKVVEHNLSKRSVEATTAAGIRTEIRTDVAGLQEQIRRMQERVREARDEADRFKDKYYELQQDLVKERLDKFLRGEDTRRSSARGVPRDDNT